jgi:hypothetical protein
MGLAECGRNQRLFLDIPGYSSAVLRKPIKFVRQDIRLQGLEPAPIFP